MLPGQAFSVHILPKRAGGMRKNAEVRGKKWRKNETPGKDKNAQPASRTRADDGAGADDEPDDVCRGAMEGV